MLAGPVPTAFRYLTMDLVRIDHPLHAIVDAFLFATLIAASLFRSAQRDAVRAYGNAQGG